MTNSSNTLNPYFSKALLVANSSRFIHSSLIRLFKKNEKNRINIQTRGKLQQFTLSPINNGIRAKKVLRIFWLLREPLKNKSLRYFIEVLLLNFKKLVIGNVAKNLEQLQINYPALRAPLQNLKGILPRTPVVEITG